jgi:protein-disulfide isomerase
MKPMLLAPLAALLLAACNPSAATDDAFGKKVRAYLLENPEVLEEVAEKLNEKKQQAALKASTAALSKHRAALEQDPRDLVANPQGRITVVEFYDYRCGYCKVVAPEVVKLIQENPDVRFVFKEFPIFGQVSDTAARVALTPAAKSKGVELHSRWMSEKSLNDAAIDRHLTELGLNPVQVRKAAQDPAIDRQIADVRALAGALNLEGTPAFVVGDVIIPGADVNALRAAILSARAGGLRQPA